LNDSIANATTFARLTRRQSHVVLVVIALTLVGAVTTTLSPAANRGIMSHGNGSSDIALYRAEADRIHAGDGYYETLAAELTARNYPTRSVFNWRTPLPIWLIGKLPVVEMGKALLGFMALALLVMAFEAVAREQGATQNLKRPIACALLLTGPLMLTAIGNLFVFPELWAGVFVALSACAYGLARPRLGVALGLAAIFFRELALPYCLVCMAMAWRQGRRRELAAWALGLSAWLAFFGLHAWQVSQAMPVDAQAQPRGWIQFGGAGFVIATAQINAYLLVPQWVTAIYLVAAMVGLAGWNTPLGTRIGLTVCLFLMAFAVVGQTFNQYWGFLIGPLLCFGVARFPASMRDLWRAATAAGKQQNPASA
jgi:hypothetical protein